MAQPPAPPSPLSPFSLPMDASGNSSASGSGGSGGGGALAAAAKARRRAARHEELRAAALTPPQARAPPQIELIAEFLAGAHGLRGLAPTTLRALAQAMEGRAYGGGAVLYRAGDRATHFFVAVSGEVALLEPAAAAAAAATVAAAAAAAAASGAQEEAIGGNVTPAATAATAASAAAADAGGMVEVRRVRPREPFGGDDLLAPAGKEDEGGGSGGVRTQTARAVDCGGDCGAATGRGGNGRGGSNRSPVGGARARPFALQVGSGCPSPAAAESPAQLDPPRTARSPATAAATAAPAAAAVLLSLRADEYARVLAGHMGRLQADKVAFLASLPALAGAAPAAAGALLQGLAHAFHRVEFGAREALVRQGDVADALYVIRSGRAVVLVDPDVDGSTATGSGGSSSSGGSGSGADKRGGLGPRQPAGGYGSGDGAGDGSGRIDDRELQRLVQVVVLGPGAVIGDMALRDGGSGSGGGGARSAPRRAATVVALGDVAAYSIPLAEWRRRMPIEVLEAMRQIADAKAAMNAARAEQRRARRAGAGMVTLGPHTVPEAVLRGRALRSLLAASPDQDGGGGGAAGGDGDGEPSGLGGGGAGGGGAGFMGADGDPTADADRLVAELAACGAPPPALAPPAAAAVTADAADAGGGGLGAALGELARRLQARGGVGARATSISSSSSSSSSNGASKGTRAPPSPLKGAVAAALAALSECAAAEAAVTSDPIAGALSRSGSCTSSFASGGGSRASRCVSPSCDGAPPAPAARPKSRCSVGGGGSGGSGALVAAAVQPLQGDTAVAAVQPQFELQRPTSPLVVRSCSIAGRCSPGALLPSPATAAAAALAGPAAKTHRPRSRSPSPAAAPTRHASLPAIEAIKLSTAPQQQQQQQQQQQHLSTT